MRLVEFAIASSLIEITPGPNMSYLAALALTRGTKAGFQAVLGVACGILIVGLLAASGLAGILSTFPVVDIFLRWGGILFMVCLAIESWWNASKDNKNRFHGRYGTFWRGLVTNLLNPKLLVFYIVMLPDFIDETSGNLILQNVTLVLIYTTIATIIHSGLIAFAGHFQQFMNTQSKAKLVGRLMAFLLLGVAVWLFIEIRH